MKEKLQEYALIAEIISAICIVLSLIFVGLQVQQGAEATDNNTEATRSQVRESIVNAELSVLQMAADHPYLLQFDFNPEEHTEQENGRAQAYFLIMLRTREDFWVQYQSGYLDEATYRSYRNILLLLIANSDFYHGNWEGWTNGSVVNRGFIEDINRELQNRRDELEIFDQLRHPGLPMVTLRQTSQIPLWLSGLSVSR